MNPILRALLKFLCCTLFLLTSPMASANSGGHEGGGAPAPLVFTVNVGSTVEEMRILQVKIVLEYATPEAAAHFAAYQPRLAHHIILTLCGESVANLLTGKGKQELQEKLASELNGVLQEDVKTGIKEVLFTDFIIQ